MVISVDSLWSKFWYIDPVRQTVLKIDSRVPLNNPGLDSCSALAVPSSTQQLRKAFADVTAKKMRESSRSRIRNFDGWENRNTEPTISIPNGPWFIQVKRFQLTSRKWRHLVPIADDVKGPCSNKSSKVFHRESSWRFGGGAQNRASMESLIARGMMYVQIKQLYFDIFCFKIHEQSELRCTNKEVRI